MYGGVRMPLTSTAICRKDPANPLGCWIGLHNAPAMGAQTGVFQWTDGTHSGSGCKQDAVPDGSLPADSISLAPLPAPVVLTRQPTLPTGSNVDYLNFASGEPNACSARDLYDVRGGGGSAWADNHCGSVSRGPWRVRLRFGEPFFL